MPRLTRSERNQQTHDLLLQSAAQLFSSQGYHAVSVEAIAEAAGFSKGAVYTRFASKEALFLALLDQRLHEEEGVIASLSGGASMAQQPPFRDTLARDRQWNLLLIEFFLYAMRNEHVRVQLAERFARWRQRLQTHIAEQHTTTALPDVTTSWLMVAVGMGLSMQAYLDPDALPEDVHEQGMKQLFKE